MRPVRPRRRRRGAAVVPWLLRALAVLVVFGAGVALGQALEERPRAGKPVTSVTTFEPWTQTSATGATRTVTVTTP